MNSGSSAPISAGAHSAEAPAISSCHQTSRPATIGTSSPVRRTTNTRSIDGVSATAASALAFIGRPLRAPRTAVSCVTSALHCESLMRSRSDSAENAPNTMECTAPMRAQASIAIASSGTICR